MDRRIAHAVRGLKYTLPKPDRKLLRRIAHAVRGLKFPIACQTSFAGMSHRSRGAWIEISSVNSG